MSRPPPPMRGARDAAVVPIARLIKGAGRGRTTRFRDRNPLNLRHANIYLQDNTQQTADGQRRGAKHDARALVTNGATLRQSLAGAGFDIPPADDEGEQ